MAYGRSMHEIFVRVGSLPSELYSDLKSAAEALVDGEPDTIANMANISALIMEYVSDLNWAGFYRVIDGELVLGPFQGKSACIRIELGKGVCGAAAATGETQRVADVDAFPGHIACDADSRSELVIPVFKGEKVAAVLDLDSPLPDRFSQEDQAGLEALVVAVSGSIA